MHNMIYSAEFLGLIPRRDEYNHQIGEMYYRCITTNSQGKEESMIIRIPRVLLDRVEVNMEHDYFSSEGYIKLKIEPKNNIFFEIIKEDNMGDFILDAFKDIKLVYQLPKFDKDQIKDVIYNDPATIVFWKDGTKTVVKCQKGDTYNPELGLAMCIIKKMCDNKGNYNDVFNKWLPSEVK